jgi:hypothetical protein
MFSSPPAVSTTTSPSQLIPQQQPPATLTTPPGEQLARQPETPKVGGKWTHPALRSIENETRKFLFGEEDLKKLILNTALLIAMWWLSRKIEDRYLLDVVA